MEMHAPFFFRDGLFSVPASLGNLVIQRGFFMATFDLQGHRGARASPARR